MATRKRASSAKRGKAAAKPPRVGEEDGKEEGGDQGDCSPWPRQRRRRRRRSTKPRRRRRAAPARSSSSSRRRRRRRSASTSAAATAFARPSATSWTCPRRSWASTSTTASRPISFRFPGRKRRIAELKSAAKDSKEVLIATDPDREGEAIAAHVATQIAPKRGAPRMPDPSRALPRDHEGRGAARDPERRRHRQQEGRGAAGASRARSSRRLQGEPGAVEDRQEGTVARAACRPSRCGSSSSASARFARSSPSSTGPSRRCSRRTASSSPPSCTTSTARRPRSTTRPRPSAILDDLKARQARSTSPRSSGASAARIRRRRSRRRTLQQEAAKKLSFGSKRTMRVAQDLYEGVELGDEGRSVSSRTCVPTRRASPRARRCRRATTCACCSARRSSPRRRSSTARAERSKNAQDAHEGVRPTDPTRRPDERARST